ncbi:folate-binding protein YgfZ [Ferrovibrio sp.]|uniref:CAF17-like 4Fe-4S cluster assembly/insertion protein YgfZ n=1 Tax=Ferrovibrio sp. TaxID=1917215 RepID=UPI0035B1A18F
MTDTQHIIALPGRALLRLEGPEAKGFLNGLVSNNVTKAAPDHALYAALLTPQGKFLADMFIQEHAGMLWLDVAENRLEDLAKRLKLYRLRAKVEIAAQPGWRAYALIGPGAAQSLDLPEQAGAAGALNGGFACIDPRLAALGARLWLPESESPNLGIPADFAAYEALRLRLGVPDGSRDIEIDKGLLLENHFEALQGVDFAKGCYVGQEVTARTKYRGLVKKQLYHVQATADLPPTGSSISQDGSDAGILLSHDGRQGLALLRNELVAKANAGGAPLLAEGIALQATLPDYAV